MIDLNRNSKVCVVGLGVIGSQTALHIKEMGFKVYGHDLSTSALAKMGNSIETFANWQDVPRCDIYVICVNTWWNETADMSAIHDVCNRISNVNKSALISIESTLVVGTCRAIFKTYDLKNLVHVPHRLWPGHENKYGVDQIRVMGTMNVESARSASAFFRMINVPIVELKSIETAELCKIVENTHRYIQIAYTQEIALLCKDIGVDFEDLKVGVNSKWNAKLLEPREGVGGVCLPKDIKFLQSLGNRTHLIDGAIQSNQEYMNSLVKSYEVLDS